MVAFSELAAPLPPLILSDRPCPRTARAGGDQLGQGIAQAVRVPSKIPSNTDVIYDNLWNVGNKFAPPLEVPFTAIHRSAPVESALLMQIVPSGILSR